jgi:hypothetical protein
MWDVGTGPGETPVMTARHLCAQPGVFAPYPPPPPVHVVFHYEVAFGIVTVKTPS